MNTMQMRAKKGGFTLLELLIVITILAILTLVVVLFINPVEILKKSRDVQRMSDLSTLNAAVGLYLQDSTSNNLGGSANCTTLAAPSSAPETGGVIRTSIATSTQGLVTFTTPITASYNATTTASLALNTGNGWIPYINFSGVNSGAPIAKLPIDPANTGLSGAGKVAGIDSLYYRYACRSSNNTFEIDATLESAAYGPSGTEDKAKTDGGNAEMRYEVGTDLRIIPSSAPLI